MVKAVLGIVPHGGHFIPELIDLGSGDLETLLNRDIEVRVGDKIFVVASTTGQGIDIFSVAHGFSGDAQAIDLTNALLVMTDQRIQGDLFDASGQPVGVSLDLYQLTAGGPTKIGEAGSKAGGGPSDTTPPVLVSTVSPAPNNAGWHKTDVTVTWSTSDPESGIGASSGCNTTALTAETTGTTLTCSATNGAGLSSTASVTVRSIRPRRPSGRRGPQRRMQPGGTPAT